MASRREDSWWKGVGGRGEPSSSRARVMQCPGGRKCGDECDVELMGYSWVEAAPWWQSWRRRGGVKSLEVNPASQSSRSLTF